MNDEAEQADDIEQDGDLVQYRIAVVQVRPAAFEPGWVAVARFPRGRRLGTYATQEEAEAVAMAFAQEVGAVLTRNRTLEHWRPGR